MVGLGSNFAYFKRVGRRQSQFSLNVIWSPATKPIENVVVSLFGTLCDNSRFFKQIMGHKPTDNLALAKHETSFRKIKIENEKEEARTYKAIDKLSLLL